MPRQTIERAVVRLAVHAPEPRPADVGEPRAELEAQQPEEAEDYVGIGPRIGHDLDRCQRGLLLQDEGQEGEAVAQRARHHDTIQTRELVAHEVLIGDAPTLAEVSGVRSCVHGLDRDDKAQTVCRGDLTPTPGLIYELA